MKKILNYIDGNLQEALSGQIIENESPVNGKVFSHIANSDKEDVELAVQSAKKAFPFWSELSKKERHDHLIRLAVEGIYVKFF